MLSYQKGDRSIPGTAALVITNLARQRGSRFTSLPPIPAWPESGALLRK
jgi:hypothetical protein